MKRIVAVLFMALIISSQVVVANANQRPMLKLDQSQLATQPTRIPANARNQLTLMPDLKVTSISLDHKCWTANPYCARVVLGVTNTGSKNIRASFKFGIKSKQSTWHTFYVDIAAGHSLNVRSAKIDFDDFWRKKQSIYFFGEVDPRNEIKELNENNNRKEYFLKIK
ncbi:MAG: hypothetical protein D6B25_20490 [Desulfobulbaceae bacterium]|nr:MAG: hypothetical protein D6B25_20490 [Desulfobulbaceae bacterium]